MLRTDPRVIRWGRRVIRWTKHRAKKHGVVFKITLAELLDLWPTICPVFGFILEPGSIDRRRKPSIDRIDPRKGYVSGNIAIISLRANQLKSDAQSWELKMVSHWMDKQ